MKNSILFFLLLITVVFTACEDAATRIDRPLLHNRDVTIAYTDTGRGNYTLVFVHGWCINRGYWENQVDYFSKNYRVVTLDLPGFGESGKNRSEWNTGIFARDVDSVIRQLGLEHVILIGHSMSGDIALQAAIDNPTQVVGLVGVDNFKSVGIPETSEAKASYDSAMQQMRTHFMETASSYFNTVLFSPSTPTKVKERVMQDVVHADTTIAVAAMEPYDFDEVAKLQNWGRPLYLVNSDLFPNDTSGLVKNNIPFRLAITPGTGHYAMIEAPEVFNKALDRILDDIKKTGGQP